ncbi:hypothetical protein GTY65_09320 [Streptomyces sp. SID8379]|uniref:hypothetical protein n=1 Tax=unclassified Streptomyces TaxID=2593676 RepID=UPI00035CF362|nr:MULTISPECIES: hypothetical protein [unclassified Streptomyces]MYW64271.1 hypothetical protein [Streptomyces sp. SID8379]
MNGSDTTTTTGPATAWPLENALVSAALAAQRVTWIDAPARALGLKPFTRPELTRQIIEQLRRTASGRPTRLRTAFGTFLMPLDSADATSLVAAADAAGARGAVTALTDEGRRVRLAPHAPLPLSVDALRDRVRKVVDAEARGLLATRQGDATLGRDDWTAAARRIARRIALGDAAADDTLVGDILDATARAADDAELDARGAALSRRIAPYVAALPVDEPVVVHALETLTRALTDTAAQALALTTIGQGPKDAVADALRRYPPLAATVHRVDAPFHWDGWDGMSIDAGTEILCATAWLRDLDDPDPYADADPVTALCAAPGSCAVAELAVLAAVALVRALARDTVPVVLAPRLDPDALPVVLPAASLRLALTNSGADPHVPADTNVQDAPPAGQSAAHYAGLTAASARRLDEHARRLAEFARRPGFNHDAFGERCRMTLLAHAERCARAAGDARKAADWLTN